MNDIFYYFGFLFIMLRLKDLIFFNKEFDELYPFIEKNRGYMSWAKKSLEGSNQMDIEDLRGEQNIAKDILSDNLKSMDNAVKPNSFSNIANAIYFIWLITGITISNLWILFLSDLLILAFFSVFPIFVQTEKNKVKGMLFFREVFGLILLGLIEYLHFN